MNKKLVSVYLDYDTALKLQKEAHLRGCSMSSLVGSIIESYFSSGIMSQLLDELRSVLSKYVEGNEKVMSNEEVMNNESNEKVMSNESNEEVMDNEKVMNNSTDPRDQLTKILRKKLTPVSDRPDCFADFDFGEDHPCQKCRYVDECIKQAIKEGKPLEDCYGKFTPGDPKCEDCKLAKLCAQYRLKKLVVSSQKAAAHLSNCS